MTCGRAWLCDKGAQKATQYSPTGWLRRFNWQLVNEVFCVHIGNVWNNLFTSVYYTYITTVSEILQYDTTINRCTDHTIICQPTKSTSMKKLHVNLHTDAYYGIIIKYNQYVFIFFIMSKIYELLKLTKANLCYLLLMLKTFKTFDNAVLEIFDT